MADAVALTKEMLIRVTETGKTVQMKGSEEASIAIIVAASQEIAKIGISPESAIGRILVASILRNVAWKLGNTHVAHHKIWADAQKLDPKK